MIVFHNTPDGYNVRLDNLEITWGNVGFLINVYENYTHVPCEYGPCPEGREQDTCPIINTCPHEYRQEEIAESICEGGYASFKEVRQRILAQLKKKRGEGPFVESWPPAAKRFLREAWIMSDETLARKSAS